MNNKKRIMKEYMKLPYQKVLNHSFEINESALAGYIDSLLRNIPISVIKLPYSEEDFCELDKIYKSLPKSLQKRMLGKYIYLTRTMIDIIKENVEN